MKIINGVVVKGSGEGRKIGVPTANVKTDYDFTSIDQGVYAVKIKSDGNEYNGVAHYGPRAVFNEYLPQFEVHIFSFTGDLYDKKIEVELVGFIRPTLKFTSMEEMLVTIKKDISEAKKLLNV